MSLTSIPEEIMLGIVDYGNSLPDLIQLMIVNKQLYMIIKLYSKFYRHTQNAFRRKKGKMIFNDFNNNTDRYLVDCEFKFKHPTILDFGYMKYSFINCELKFDSKTAFYDYYKSYHANPDITLEINPGLILRICNPSWGGSRSITKSKGKYIIMNPPHQDVRSFRVDTHSNWNNTWLEYYVLGKNNKVAEVSFLIEEEEK